MHLVADAVQVGRHTRVPAPRVVAEMYAGFEQLAQGKLRHRHRRNAPFRSSGCSSAGLAVSAAPDPALARKGAPRVNYRPLGWPAGGIWRSGGRNASADGARGAAGGADHWPARYGTSMTMQMLVAGRIWPFASQPNARQRHRPIRTTADLVEAGTERLEGSLRPQVRISVIPHHRDICVADVMKTIPGYELRLRSLSSARTGRCQNGYSWRPPGPLTPGHGGRAESGPAWKPARRAGCRPCCPWWFPRNDRALPPAKRLRPAPSCRMTHQGPVRATPTSLPSDAPAGGALPRPSSAPAQRRV